MVVVTEAQLWALHLTADHPPGRSAQQKGRGEEGSSEPLDFSVVFACLI